MALTGIEALAELVPETEVLAGLDLGTKTIGIAVSDLSFRFAQPRMVLRRVKFGADAALLKKTLDEARVGGIVIGLPLNMDGSEGPRVQSTRAFVRNYVRLDERPIAFWDERLSTVAATRGLIEMDVSRAKRAERIDAAAAAFILQGALDRIAAMRDAGTAS